jgi:hypothetical protein
MIAVELYQKIKVATRVVEIAPRRRAEEVEPPYMGSSGTAPALPLRFDRISRAKAGQWQRNISGRRPNFDQRNRRLFDNALGKV